LANSQKVIDILAQRRVLLELSPALGWGHTEEREDMKTRHYLYITDPGHGWLAVPSATIRKLGIAQDITPYSYVSDSGKTVYCEEDCDAVVVLDALRAQGIALCTRMVNNAHNYSSIRGMRSYSPGAIGVIVVQP
jgi:hypothetical protein